MLLCPALGCPDAKPFVGELAAHLRNAHFYERDASIAAAKMAPVRVDDVLHSMQEPVAQDAIPTLVSPAPKETPMPTKAHAANPAA